MRSLLLLLLLAALGVGLLWVLAPSDGAGSAAESAAAAAAAPGGAAPAETIGAGELLREAASGADAGAAAAARTGFRARLLGSAGQPAPGAELRAEWGNRSQELRVVRAGADGVAQLTGLAPGPAPRLRAGGDHWSEVELPAAEPLAPGELRDLGTWTLAPASRLVGMVRAPDGGPRPGARIELERADGLLRQRELRDVVKTLVADPEGRFTIPGVPPGTYRLRAESDGCGGAVLEPLHLAGRPEDVPVELRLTPGTPVAGHVRDPDGRPLAEARVLLWTESADTEPPSPEEVLRRGAPVQPDGRFAVGGDRSPGACTVLSAAAPGHATEQVPLTAADGEIEVVLAPRVAVRGRVFASGAPAAGAEVHLRPAASRGRTETTDAEGRFAFEDVAPGVYQAWAASAAGSCEVLPLIVAAGLPDLRLDLVDAPGVTVRVSDDAGAPLADAQVRLEPDDLWAQGFEGEWEWSAKSFTTGEAGESEEGDRDAPAASPGAASAASAAAALDAPADGQPPRARPERVVLVPRIGRTGADGIVRFADVPEGVWQVQAERPGYRLGTDLVDLDLQGRRSVTLALQPAGLLRVLLADERGTPIAGSPVQLIWRPLVGGEEEGPVMQSRVTDAAGRASWEELAANDYTVRAVLGLPPGAVGPAAGERALAASAAPGGSEIGFALAPGETRELVLTVRGAALASALVSFGGAPAARARVALIEGSLSASELDALRFTALEEGASIADGSGRAQLPAVAPGAYTLVARRDASSPARCAAVELRAGPQELRIQLPAGSVTGRAVGVAGPLAGAAVFLLAPGAQRAIPERDRLGGEAAGAGGGAPAERLVRVLDESGCMGLTDADGRFRFEAVPPGLYRVQVHAPAYAPVEIPAFAHDGVARMDLGEQLLSGAGALAGALAGAGAGEWIQLTGPSGEARFVATAAGGRWLCDRLAPGAWSVVAWPGAAAAPPMAIEVRAGVLAEVPALRR